MKSTLLPLVLGAALIVQPAHADDRQVEAGYSFLMMKDDTDVNLGALVIRGGAQFHQNFGAEVEAGIGLGDDSVSAGGFTAKVKLNYTFGAYVTYAHSLSEELTAIGRVGLVHTDIEADAGFGAASDSASGLAAGAGLRYFPGNGLNGVRADYTFQKLDDTDTHALTATYVRRF